MGSGLKVGEVVRVKAEIVRHAYCYICGNYITRKQALVAVGKHFRIKDARKFVKGKKSYYLGFVEGYSLWLPKKFLERIDTPCITLKKKGEKIY